MIAHNCLRRFSVLLLMGALHGFSLAQDSTSALADGFRNPPDSAKPRVWWHWLNGNVTKEGITADLEWMKRVNIAGMQMFDGNLNTPVFVDKKLVWMTPEWKDAFRHAGAEADRLGLEMAMAASGGWSETAGPWVKPEEAMKKIVWSELSVDGAKKFSGALRHPPTNNGRIQNVPVPAEEDFPPVNMPGAKPQPKLPPPPPDSTFYADTAVIAFRTPDTEVSMVSLHPKVSASAAGLNLASLTDGDWRHNLDFPFAENGNPTFIQLEFTQPFRTQAFTIAAGTPRTYGGPSIPDGEVQASPDGVNWTTITSLPGPSHPDAGFPVRTYSFPAITARFYRVIFRRREPKPTDFLWSEFLGFPMKPAPSFKLAQIEFHSGARINHWQEKAAFANMLEYENSSVPVAPNEAVAMNNVVDLTSKMRTDGSLDWQVPRGKWTIMRFGYSLTGEKNHPATREATGYEVDKLSHKYVENYAKNYVAMISAALGPYFGKSFRYFVMDSWEASDQNWTDDMAAEFRNRRGYDLTRYLPVLTGRVIESSDVSERFLWDYRRTIADLLAENHYAVATQYFHKSGVALYAEAMGSGLPTVGDGLLNKGQVDIPMGEFWTTLPTQPDTPDHPADVREASSAAHIYGKPIIATESFTSMPYIPAWGQSPFYLKPISDAYLAAGVNRIIFHTADQQPFVDEAHKPGMTLGFFGQHYGRNITWAEQAVAWNTYLARCSYLLQQGRFVADLAYYYGEGAPATVPYWKVIHPAPPEGYSYDYMNTDVLLNRLSVKDGRLVLPGGMSYKALVIPDDIDRLTLPVVRQIRELVDAGAIVIAPRPGKSPSLTGYPNADDEIRAIANDVWGPVDGKSITEHRYGKGKVYWGKSVAEVLAAAKTLADFAYNRPSLDTKLVWIHRNSPDADLYFVANQRPHPDNVLASFRVEGKQAELWHPDTGEIEQAEYNIENGRTNVPLHLDPDGSVFVVFRHVATAPLRTLPHPVSTVLVTLQGPWNLGFPPNWGAPSQITLEILSSWTNSSDVGVKYFSGTATYTKQIDAAAAWFQPGAKIVLDLGNVKEIAELSVNGKSVGEILWKPPFRADVTRALKPGANHIEIKVTNLWPNRLIGDAQPDTQKKYTFTDFPFYKASSPLMESGLLGPVSLISIEMQ
ncbi:MAG: glycoside hydrolase [Acidobacteria bacterium]|nr:MAG: glycoside hydrolase [Acidobacteriota bacterium]